MRTIIHKVSGLFSPGAEQRPRGRGENIYVGQGTCQRKEQGIGITKGGAGWVERTGDSNVQSGRRAGWEGAECFRSEGRRL